MFIISAQHPNSELWLPDQLVLGCAFNIASLSEIGDCVGFGVILGLKQLIMFSFFNLFNLVLDSSICGFVIVAIILIFLVQDFLLIIVGIV